MAKAALLANLQQGVKNLDKDQRQILSGLFADMNLAAPESVQKKEKKRERLAAVASNPSHAAKGKKKQQQLSRGLALPAPQPTLAGPQQAQAQQPEGSSPSTSEEAAATGDSRGDDKDGRDDHSDGDDDIDDAEESLLSDSLLSDAIQGLKFLSEGRMVDRSKIYVENGSLMVYAPKVRYFFDFDVFSPRRIGGPFPLFHPLFSASMTPLLASQSHPPPPFPSLLLSLSLLLKQSRLSDFSSAGRRRKGRHLRLPPQHDAHHRRLFRRSPRPLSVQVPPERREVHLGRDLQRPHEAGGRCREEGRA